MTKRNVYLTRWVNSDEITEINSPNDLTIYDAVADVVYTFASHAQALDAMKQTVKDWNDEDEDLVFSLNDEGSEKEIEEFWDAHDGAGNLRAVIWIKREVLDF